MEQKNSPPLFARIMLGVSALLTVGVVYWFLSKALEATPTPEASVPKAAQSFNTRADVTKNAVFPRLEQKYFVDIPDMPVGRENPFLALDNVSATSAESIPKGGAPAKNSKLRINPAVTSTEEGVSEGIGSPAVTSTNSAYE